MIAARLAMPLYHNTFLLKVTSGFLSSLFDLPSIFLFLFEANQLTPSACVILINLRSKEQDRC
jgi:hypothetical protein